MAPHVASARAGEPPVAAHTASRWTALERAHLLAGAATLVAFLISGAYMALHRPRIGTLEAGLHVTFTSRHIYMLASALINLLIGVYLRPTATRGARASQSVGSLLLLVAAVLLVAAFMVEPMSGRYRTPVSAFGLYSLFAGSLLHVGAVLRTRVEG